MYWFRCDGNNIKTFFVWVWWFLEKMLLLWRYCELSHAPSPLLILFHCQFSQGFLNYNSFYLPASWTFSVLIDFLGVAPTSICHFFRPTFCPSVRRAQYLRNCTSSDYNFWYTYVKWYLRVVFHFFKILIFWAVRKVKGQKMPQNKKIITSVARHILGIV